MDKSWHEIYRIFSKYLLEFYSSNKKEKLAGELLYDTCRELDPNSQTISWLKNLTDVCSIDPIHIFSSFNYWHISSEKRKDKILFFCKALEYNGIDTRELVSIMNTSKIDSLDVFKYFPHINITYIVSAREAKVQEEIWKFFSYLCNSKRDTKKLDEVFYSINNNQWFGIRIESATIFMFWVDSDTFLPLDKNTLALLKENNVIATVPKTYTKYKRLLEKNNFNLYRNLVQVALDRKFKFNLSIDEQKDIDNYLLQQLDKSSNIKQTLMESLQAVKKQQRKRLDLEEIKLFYFELYIMINGKVKKIQNSANNGFSIQNIVLLNKIKNLVSYPNFQIIAIKILDDKYTKILDSGKFYYFNKNFQIHNENIEIVNDKSVAIYEGYSINNINICAIVGKNGMGKSTLIELLIMAINNITYNLKEQDNLDEIKELFYTIYTNYSLHALNEKNYEGAWLSKLFHKNDAYQTPLVIEPFREKGNIEINRLDSLTKQRLLSTLLDPDSGMEQEKRLYVTEKQKADKLIISINKDKILKLTNSENRSILKEKIPETNIDKELQKNTNTNIINYLESTQTIFLLKKNKATYLEKVAMLYICNKIKNIAETYFYYNKYSNSYSSEEYLDLLLQDKSHITFKLFQAINYLKYHHYENIQKSESILDIMERIKKVKEKNPDLKTIELIPPAFFTVDIMLEDGVKFDELSSGEKQKIYNISSIIYHLQNIDSSHRRSEESIKYNYVNLILDEIEMFFHPEMQKNFITDLLSDIQNKTQLDNITGINIMLITHSPFILSDITKSNILCLGQDDDKMEETFGANIHTLLNNSFFMKSGVMGSYAKNKIESILSILQSLKKGRTPLSKSEMSDIKNIIYSIGEPFLKNKLMEMFLSIENDALKEIKKLKEEREEIDKKIKTLESKIR